MKKETESTDLPIGEISGWWYDSSTPSTHCYHKWVKYEGFTERYEFCVKCDEKREIDGDDKKIS